MGRQFKESFPLKDGSRVGYSLKRRGKFYLVQFYGPDDEYHRSTTCQRIEAEARIAAGRIINDVYYPTVKAKSISWDDFIDKLEKSLTVNNNRRATFIDYRKTINAIRDTLPDTNGPLDITPTMAQQFKDDYFSGTFKRAKGAEAKVYNRSHTTLEAAIRKASSIWNKWLRKTYHLTDNNPWASVEGPRKDKKKPKAPDEATVLDFFKWLWETKYPKWRLPLTFMMLKCALGCRLHDICSLRVNQLKSDGIYFEADQTKQRDEHTVKLPAELVEQLNAIKGRRLHPR